MKCIKMRCSEYLPWLGARHCVQGCVFSGFNRDSDIKSTHKDMLSTACLYVYMCHMQVGPDNFGLHSTRPQLFWKQ